MGGREFTVVSWQEEPPSTACTSAPWCSSCRRSRFLFGEGSPGSSGGASLDGVAVSPQGESDGGPRCIPQTSSSCRPGPWVELPVNVNVWLQAGPLMEERLRPLISLVVSTWLHPCPWGPRCILPYSGG